ncbi:MAG: hypothetical protein V5A68_01045 [Candidatus Thermoplasmatota archaeon]
MVTTSHVVKKIIDSTPKIQEAMIENIVNYANLAEKIQPKIESELGKKVKKSTIRMALRRHSKNLKQKTQVNKKFIFETEIIMKTNLCDICIVKTPSSLDKIKKIYQLIDYNKGDTLNVIQGNYQITIVVSQKHLEKIKKILNKENILNIESNLVSLTLDLTKDFLYTPGIIAYITRKLSWENINIFENISTMTELIFILDEKDAVRAYESLKKVIKTKEHKK